MFFYSFECSTEWAHIIGSLQIGGCLLLLVTDSYSQPGDGYVFFFSSRHGMTNTNIPYTLHMYEKTNSPNLFPSSNFYDWNGCVSNNKRMHFKRFQLNVSRWYKAIKCLTCELWLHFLLLQLFLYFFRCSCKQRMNSEGE